MTPETTLLLERGKLEQVRERNTPAQAREARRAAAAAILARDEAEGPHDVDAERRRVHALFRGTAA